MVGSAPRAGRARLLGGVRLVTVAAVIAVSVWWGQAVASTATAAAAGCPTQVRLAGSNFEQLNVFGCSSPGDPDAISVSHNENLPGGELEVVDLRHPLEPVAPCVRADTPNQARVVCPEQGVSSVLVVTDSGDDSVGVTSIGPAFILTGDGNDRVYTESSGTVLLGNGNDQITPAASVDVFGGNGTDTVSYSFFPSGAAVSLDDVANDGGGSNIHSDVENIIGTDHNDVLTGSATSNHIDGLEGNDLIDGGLGADVLDGGLGTDAVSYADRTANLSVRLDGLANDGQAGEADNLLQVENVTGGSGNDVLVGDLFRNVLSGGPGNDSIAGLGQDDVLAGGPGRDILDAGQGTDTVTYVDHAGPVTASLDGIANDGQAGEGDNVLNAENIIGGSGNDTLTGNAGPNILRGLAGNDRLFGLAGNDTLIGSEGTDTAAGGTGTDTCQAETTTGCP
jgi:Ca2+-binding RTX toxin-like protein